MKINQLFWFNSFNLFIIYSRLFLLSNCTSYGRSFM